MQSLIVFLCISAPVRNQLISGDVRDVGSPSDTEEYNAAGRTQGNVLRRQSKAHGVRHPHEVHRIY